MQDVNAIDRYDLKILAALQEDARLTNQQLAERVHLSASQCSRRRSRLEEEGFIRRYRADLAADRLGLGVTVFISVSLSTHNRDNARRFAELIGRLPQVLEAHALTGNMDYMLKVIVPDLKALSALVSEELLPHESVAHVHSSIALNTIKDSNQLPLVGLGGFGG